MALGDPFKLPMDEYLTLFFFFFFVENEKVYLAMEAGYFEKVEEYCERYSLSGFVNVKGLLAVLFPFVINLMSLVWFFSWLKVQIRYNLCFYGIGIKMLKSSFCASFSFWSII